MPWYGWVFALPLWAAMLWSFVELAVPLLLLVAGLVRWRFFLRAALVFATSLWAFLCLGTLVKAAVVAANADGYRPATFTVRGHVVGSGEGAGWPHAEGVIDGRHPEVYVPAGYFAGRAAAAEAVAAVPVARRLDVLYNPDAPPDLRVVDPADDLAGRESALLARWAALGLLPWVAALVVRFRWRASLRPDPGDGPGGPALGAGAVRARPADLGADVPSTPISHGSTFTTPLRPRVTVAGDTLTLETHRGVRGLGWVMLCWGLAAAVLAAVALARGWEPAAKLVFLAQGTFMPMVGLAMIALPARHEFDRAAGVYARRSPVASARRPLSEVLAVQVIPGRPAESSDGLRYQTYELNLVFRSGGVRRECVACLADGDWVRTAGRAVAEFLGVPVIDGVPA